jgi:hypothetical protein
LAKEPPTENVEIIGEAPKEYGEKIVEEEEKKPDRNNRNERKLKIDSF